MNFVTNVFKKYIQNESKENLKISKEDTTFKQDLASDSKHKENKPRVRVSILETFDPLYGNSPKKEEPSPSVTGKRKQIISEDSDSSACEDNSKEVEAAADSENEIFVDANLEAPTTNIINKNTAAVEESFIKFYTPEKFAAREKLIVINGSIEKKRKSNNLLDELNTTFTSSNQTEFEELNISNTDVSEQEQAQLLSDQETVEETKSDENQSHILPKEGPSHFDSGLESLEGSPLHKNKTVENHSNALIEDSLISTLVDATVVRDKTIEFNNNSRHSSRSSLERIKIHKKLSRLSSSITSESEHSEIVHSSEVSENEQESSQAEDSGVLQEADEPVKLAENLESSQIEKRKSIVTSEIEEKPEKGSCDAEENESPVKKDLEEPSEVEESIDEETKKNNLDEVQISQGDNTEETVEFIEKGEENSIYLQNNTKEEIPEASKKEEQDIEVVKTETNSENKNDKPFEDTDKEEAIVESESSEKGEESSQVSADDKKDKVVEESDIAEKEEDKADKVSEINTCEIEEQNSQDEVLEVEPCQKEEIYLQELNETVEDSESSEKGLPSHESSEPLLTSEDNKITQAEETDSSENQTSSQQEETKDVLTSEDNKITQTEETDSSENQTSSQQEEKTKHVESSENDKTSNEIEHIDKPLLTSEDNKIVQVEETKDVEISANDKVSPEIGETNEPLLTSEDNKITQKAEETDSSDNQENSQREEPKELPVVEISEHSDNQELENSETVQENDGVNTVELETVTTELASVQESDGVNTVELETVTTELASKENDFTQLKAVEAFEENDKTIIGTPALSSTIDKQTNTEFSPSHNKQKLVMADLNEKLNQLQQEASDLKLQLNASQQAKASLELEISKKDEIIIKTQAEALKSEQLYKQELKQLKESLKEKSILIEKGGSKELEEALKAAKARESQALSELNTRNKDLENFRKVMEEFDAIITAKVAEYNKLEEEHQQATRHLANLELGFSDVHQKYERAKTIIAGFKANEETLRQNLAESADTAKQYEERYESLKAYAKGQIEKSNKEYLLLRDKYEAEIAKLKAIIKRVEIKCCSFESALEQKTQECAALSALCDEVTGKKV